MFGIQKNAQAADAIRAALNPGELAELENVVPLWDPKKPITVNTIRAVLSEMGVAIRINLISGRAEVAGLDERYSRENAAEIFPTLVRDYIVAAGGRVLHETVIRALGVIADEGRFHPVVDMLHAEPWDGVDRLAEVYSILGIGADSLDAVLVRKWLHQTVALALNEGEEPYGADGVLTLFGRQGCGKTSFLRALAYRADWFLEGAAIDMGVKDTIVQAVGVWICELGEVDGMLRKEQAQLKGFLTSPVDVFRAPYARTSTRRPRRTSFAATVNDRGFLTDGTGSRRFWVVNVERVDLGQLGELDVPMLWRQVYETCFMCDPQGFRLSSDERAQLEERNCEFERPLEYEEEIQNQLDWTRPVERWKPTRALDFRSHIDGANVSTVRLGRALSKIASRDSRVKVTHGGNYTRYLLPYIYELP